MDEHDVPEMIEICCWSCDALIAWVDPDDTRDFPRYCGFAGEVCKRDEPSPAQQADFDAERDREIALGIW